jgi:hypothetical protein
MADVLFCDDFLETYKEKRFIILQGHKPLLDTVMLNLHYKPKLESVGFTTNGNTAHTISLMKAVARCILAPSQGVQDMLNRFYNTYSILPFQEVIGVRILCYFFL